MQENLIKLHSIILDGDLTEAAKLCDELLAAAQQGVQPDAFIVDPQDGGSTMLITVEYEKLRGDGFREHGWLVKPLYTHPTTQGLDQKLLSLDSDLLVESRRALWRLSQDYEDNELRLRAQEHLERIDERRCVGRENIFNSHAAVAAQAKQGEQA